MADRKELEIRVVGDGDSLESATPRDDPFDRVRPTQAEFEEVENLKRKDTEEKHPVDDLESSNSFVESIKDQDNIEELTRKIEDEGEDTKNAEAGIASVVTAVSTGFLALVRATELAVDAFGAIKNIVDEAVDELGQFNGVIAAELGREQVEQVQSKLRSGRINQEEIAAFVDARSETAVLLRDIRTQIIEVFGPSMVKIVRLLNLILAKAILVVEIMEGALVKISAEIQAFAQGLADSGNRFVAPIGKLAIKFFNLWIKLGQKEDKAAAKTALDQILDPGFRAGLANDANRTFPLRHQRGSGIF